MLRTIPWLLVLLLLAAGTARAGDDENPEQALRRAQERIVELQSKLEQTDNAEKRDRLQREIEELRAKLAHLTEALHGRQQMQTRLQHVRAIAEHLRAQIEAALMEARGQQARERVEQGEKLLGQTGQGREWLEEARGRLARGRLDAAREAIDKAQAHLEELARKVEQWSHARPAAGGEENPEQAMQRLHQRTKELQEKLGQTDNAEKRDRLQREIAEAQAAMMQLRQVAESMRAKAEHVRAEAMAQRARIEAALAEARREQARDRIEIAERLLGSNKKALEWLEEARGRFARGRVDAANEAIEKALAHLREVAEQAERWNRAREHAEAPRAPEPPHAEALAKVEHLRQAAHHLRAAGGAEEAERLEQKAAAMEREIRQAAERAQQRERHPAPTLGEVVRALQELKREVQALRKEVQALREKADR